jgi:hypothetical protein
MLQNKTAATSRGGKPARLRCRFLDAAAALLAKAHWLGQLRVRGRVTGRDHLVRASEPIRFIERYQRQYQ